MPIGSTKRQATAATDVHRSHQLVPPRVPGVSRRTWRRLVAADKRGLRGLAAAQIERVAHAVTQLSAGGSWVGARDHQLHEGTG
jgi:hypothetical protein